MAAILLDGRHFYMLNQAGFMKTLYIMNNELYSDYCIKFKFFQAQKGSNVTLLFVNNL